MVICNQWADVSCSVISLGARELSRRAHRCLTIGTTHESRRPARRVPALRRKETQYVQNPRAAERCFRRKPSTNVLPVRFPLWLGRPAAAEARHGSVLLVPDQTAGVLSECKDLPST